MIHLTLDEWASDIEELSIHSMRQREQYTKLMIASEKYYELAKYNRWLKTTQRYSTVRIVREAFKNKHGRCKYEQN